MKSFLLSGWQDSNLRPPRPKRGAITGLRYTPKWLSLIDYYHFTMSILRLISSLVPGETCHANGVVHPEMVILNRLLSFYYVNTTSNK